MLITIDPESSQPLAEQVAASVRAALSKGTAQAGDKLPAARTVASALEINLHTVLRGYQQLRDEGLVELRRGRGAVIIANGSRSELNDAARSFARTVRHIGATEEEAISALRTAMRE
ncbi:DNA-binding transcriptional regulator YhcF (GntR family) [Lipingzhangella halophila]|uniref:DNA-binding transcriptional regulator YhcF (GntR family) n=1 Tax=Lipingzhangella halophila TaxID=1783352 RepID=A0A7W7W3T0_9ACTN|nr:GntR family transcriptional regulator [Lipingzhangella halophila]MBB4932040.1 DNA-binding transcriptional regulator YhcF (GntR family) [Lipingzhangella halophila]